jgi:hypothetical protein
MMDKYRFSELLESTMGNVKPLISENETNGTTIEIKSSSDIPQSLVDEAAPTCKYESGGRNPFFELVDTTRGTTGGYRFRFSVNIVQGFNYGNNMEGHIEAATNDLFLSEQKDNSGKKVVAKFGDEETPANEVVKNSKDKWIGFTSNDNTVRFACFNQVNGVFGCRKYKWVEI